MVNPSSNIMPFLTELQLNNNKEWFDANRKWYKAASADFTQLVTEMISILSDINPEFIGTTAKDSIYRIFRDLRFSYDKTPYKTHFAANIAQGGKNSPRAGFYIQFEPHNLSMCGGGVWIEDKAILKAIRDELYSVPEDLVEILENKGFRKFYNDGLWNYQKLKNVPNGYDRDFKYADLLKYKHFIVSCSMTDEQVSAKNLYEHIAMAYNAVHPMCRLMNDIIDSMGMQ